MGHLLGVSAELLLSIASFCRQVDLLNVSLTCKHLRVVTEPELFREYDNPKDTRTFTPFLKRLLERPDLIKYVRRIELKGWDTLGNKGCDIFDENETVEGFDRYRGPEPTEVEYTLFTDAAKDAGVISSIFPYERESHVIKKVKSMVGISFIPDHTWYEYVFDSKIAFKEISYDRKFCQLLRAGLEDPLVVLLVALLPNIRDIYLQGPPHDILTLPWRVPRHQFRALRSFRACTQYSLLSWPIGFFNNLLTAKHLETLEVCCASSWWSDDEVVLPRQDLELFFPLSLQPASVHVRRLNLQYCTLSATEMEKLLGACSQLKSLYYWASPTDDSFSNHFSAADLIRFLEPHKDILEQLSADIWSENMLVDDRIKSLSHFTSLKVLDTASYMWEELIEDEEIGRYLLDDSHLHNRLPRSLEELIFHLRDFDLPIETVHLDKLVRTRSEKLPHLRKVFVTATEAEYRDELLDLRDHVERTNVHSAAPLEFQVGDGRHAGGPIHTVFDVTLSASDLPETRWFGDRYARRRKKPSKFTEATKRLLDEHRDEDLSDAELLAMMGELDEIKELKENPGVLSQVEHKSEDCDE